MGMTRVHDGSRLVKMVKIGPKVDFRWVCGLISCEVGQGSRPTFRCGQEVKA